MPCRRLVILLMSDTSDKNSGESLFEILLQIIGDSILIIVVLAMLLVASSW